MAEKKLISFPFMGMLNTAVAYYGNIKEILDALKKEREGGAPNEETMNDKIYSRGCELLMREVKKCVLNHFLTQVLPPPAICSGLDDEMKGRLKEVITVYQDLYSDNDREIVKLFTELNFLAPVSDAVIATHTEREKGESGDDQSKMVFH